MIHLYVNFEKFNQRTNTRFMKFLPITTLLIGARAAINRDSPCETNGSITVCKIQTGVVDVIGIDEKYGCTITLKSVKIPDMENIQRAVKWFPQYIFQGCIFAVASGSKDFAGMTAVSEDKKSVTCRSNGKIIGSYTSKEVLSLPSTQYCGAITNQRSQLKSVSNGAGMMQPIKFGSRTGTFSVGFNHPDVVQIYPQMHCSVTVRIPENSKPESVRSVYERMFGGTPCLGGGSGFAAKKDMQSRETLPVTKIFVGALPPAPGQHHSQSLSVVVCWSGDQLLGRYQLRSDWEHEEGLVNDKMKQATLADRAAMRYADGGMVDEFSGGEARLEIHKGQAIGICREIAALRQQLGQGVTNQEIDTSGLQI